MRAILYVIECRDPKIRARYLGYTTDWKQCLEYRSDEYDYGSNARSKLYTFIREHGGWRNWVLKKLAQYGSREEALIAKIDLLERYPFELNSHLKF